MQIFFCCRKKKKSKDLTLFKIRIQAVKVHHSICSQLHSKKSSLFELSMCKFPRQKCSLPLCTDSNFRTFFEKSYNFYEFLLLKYEDFYLKMALPSRKMYILFSVCYVHTYLVAYIIMYKMVGKSCQESK